MMVLQAELENWMSAISCLGREPLDERKYGSLDEGGAINALYQKKVINGQAVKAADPQEAYALIGRSMNYIRQTENLFEDEIFTEKSKRPSGPMRPGRPSR